MKTFAVINIAKKDLGLDDETYRDALERVTGKRSLRAMSEAQRLAVVDDFKAKGFKINRGGKSVGNKAGFSSKKYVRLIHALWSACAKLGVIDDGSKKALRSFVATQTEKRGARIDDPDFLTYDQASPIIETLKSMEKRGKVKGK